MSIKIGDRVKVVKEGFIKRYGGESILGLTGEVKDTDGMWVIFRTGEGDVWSVVEERLEKVNNEL
tara:strand:- start:1058 stop:1252 length:195 start_codon:yes stop_codon:yes gene_type:complete